MAPNETAASRQLARKTAEAPKVSPAQTVKTASPVAEIAKNPFYQLHFASKETLEVRQKQLVELLVAANTKEFEEFKSWLAWQRREMNTELMRLTNTEVFSNLQKVIEHMEKGLLEYEEEMLPLADLLDSIDNIQSNGLTGEVYKEIAEDRKNEAEDAEYMNSRNKDIMGIGDRIRNLRSRNDECRADTNFFGNIKKAAQVEIAANERSIAELEAQLGKLETELTAKNEVIRQRTSKLGAFVRDKDRLRAMLDLNSDEIKQRHAAMVEKALNFVRVNEERLSSTRDDQIKQMNLTGKLEDANHSMVMIHAGLTDGLQTANDEIIRRRDSFAKVPDGETATQKAVREQTLRDIDRQLERLVTSRQDSLTGLSELTDEGIKVRSMRQANEQQTSLVEALYTRGIANVSANLNVTLQSLNITALAQTTNLIKGTMSRMQDLTSKVAQRQVVQNAMRMEADVAEMSRSIENLQAMGEAVTASTEITRKVLLDAKAQMAELASVVRQTDESTREARGVTAEVMRDNPTENTKPKAEAANNPFNLGTS